MDQIIDATICFQTKMTLISESISKKEMLIKKVAKRCVSKLEKPLGAVNAEKLIVIRLCKIISSINLMKKI